MNKHFMKLIAAAVSIPLAVAPCTMPAAYAETTVTMTASAPLAQATAVLIDLTASDLTDVRTNAYSGSWNTLVEAGLWCCDATACTMDLTALYETVTANAGAYAPFLEQLFSCVSEETLTYADSVFTINASVSSISDVLADENGVTLAAQIETLEAQYGVELGADSSALAAACDVKITADFSNVGTSRTIRLSYDVTTEDGTYTLLGSNSVFTYLSSKLDAYAASVESAAAEQPAEIADAVTAAVESFRSRLNSLASVDASVVTAKDITISGVSLSDTLAQLEQSYPDQASRIPASAESIAQLLESSWNSLMTQINTNVVPEGGAVNLDVHEIAAVFDSLTNVTLTMKNGVASISGTLEDTQSEAVKAYYAENAAALAALAASAEEAGDADATGLSLYEEGMTLAATAKTVEASFPLTILESGIGDVYYNIYRTYTFNVPAATETTTSEETTVTETEETTTSEETTVTETEETTTSEETTVTETEETTTSEETTVTEDTTISEETTVTETEDTTTSEETTVTETEDTTTSEETTVTETEEPTETTATDDGTERPDCSDKDKHHCGRHHHRHHHHHHGDRHENCQGRPEWDWTECPEWDWTECPEWDWTECPEWDWTECPEWDWTECPECEEALKQENCGERENHRNGGRREHFREFQQVFNGFAGMNFEGGTPCISLNR